MLRDTGIWQGRFQYIHNGHTHMFSTELTKFNNKMVAIVNPNPFIPAKNFDRFGAQQNPFNYFQRMLLWKSLALHEDIDITIIPCWHARYIIALENDFLPPRNLRSWIVPVSQDDREEDKSRDLRDKGEDVYDADFMSEPVECRSISATMIRRCLESNNIAYRQYIPNPICSLTEQLALGEDPYCYYFVPFIDDKLDLHSLQYAIDQVHHHGENTYLVIAISVHVSEGELEWKNEHQLPWWFKNVKPGYKTYYKKAQLINKLMKELNLKKFLLVPLFVMHSNFNYLKEYNYAFLPRLDKTNWIINEECDSMYRNDFLVYLDNIDVEDNIIFINNDIQINNVVSDFFRRNSSYVQIEGSHAVSEDFSARRTVLEKTTDRLFDKKFSEIEERINAGYDPETEDQRKNQLMGIQVWAQQRISQIFISNSTEIPTLIRSFELELTHRVEGV